MVSRCPYCHADISRPDGKEIAPNQENQNTSENEKARNSSNDISAGDPKNKSSRKKNRLALSGLIVILVCAAAVMLYQRCGQKAEDGTVGDDTDSIALVQDTIRSQPVPPDFQGPGHIPVDSVPDTVPQQPAPRDNTVGSKSSAPTPVVEKGETYYTITDTHLTRDTNAWSLISSPRYGTKLIKIGDGSDGYTKVIYGKLSGYVLNRYILNEDDFRLFESIFGSNEALKAIPYADFRRALFDYYKSHNMEGWHFVLHNGRNRPDEVLFKCIFPKFSEYKHYDMAIILEKSDSKERKILIFQGKDNGDIQFVFEDSTYPALYYISDVSAHKNVLQIVYSHIEKDNIITEGPIDVYDEYHGRYLRR